ncbi:hypothetical protein DLM78_05455 [Leptospira stimsonii]|uniref:Uncharacterized protein n=1 Tax=Leptospira stimsonii TaxID=2202203 RepID=A0A8B3CW27_9LEPT|nr:hypothetical protein DLM78_05455 [Leptospira stimsonii]
MNPALRSKFFKEFRLSLSRHSQRKRSSDLENETNTTEILSRTDLKSKSNLFFDEIHFVGSREFESFRQGMDFRKQILKPMKRIGETLKFKYFLDVFSTG